jgi:hypothetical protein
MKEARIAVLRSKRGAIELVMASSPERDDAVETAFLDFIRSRRKLIRSTLKGESG